jgi:hypothetical protein
MGSANRWLANLRCRGNRRQFASQRLANLGIYAVELAAVLEHANPQALETFCPQVIRQICKELLPVRCAIFTALLELDKMSADHPVAQYQRLIDGLRSPAEQGPGGCINGYDELLVVHAGRGTSNCDGESRR